MSLSIDCKMFSSASGVVGDLNGFGQQIFFLLHGWAGGTSARAETLSPGWASPLAWCAQSFHYRCSLLSCFSGCLILSCRGLLLRWILKTIVMGRVHPVAAMATLVPPFSPSLPLILVARNHTRTQFHVLSYMRSVKSKTWRQFQACHTAQSTPSCSIRFAL